jgi:hypothetical protein
MRADLAEVQLPHGAQGLRMDLASFFGPVEPSTHEVGATAFLQQSALGHLDARFRCH